MRTILFTLFALLSINLTCFAQTIVEGKLSYNVEYTSQDPDTQSQLDGMFNGSHFLMYFTPNSVRTEIHMGTVMTTSMVEHKGQKLMLIDAMGGAMKFATKSKNVANTEKLSDDEEDIVVEKTDETKVIAGLSCTKYNIISEDGELSYCWVTKDLGSFPLKSTNNVEFLSKIDDAVFPMEYEMKTPEMTIKFTATDFEKGISKAQKKQLFSLKIPKGYTEMSEEELAKFGAGGF